jgi:hypothetical protein
LCLWEEGRFALNGKQTKLFIIPLYDWCLNLPQSRKLESYADYKRSIKKGFGLGLYEEYKPWLRVQDVPSNQNSEKINGITTGRPHHMLSPLESDLFYQLDFQDNVVDIREQFPIIPLEYSSLVARLLEIKHPVVPFIEDGPLNVITTDFLVTRQINDKLKLFAYSGKSLSDIEKPRTTEKLEIERVIWQLLGVSFQIFTSSPTSKVISKNLKWMTSPLRNSLFQDIDEKLLLAVVSKIDEGFYSLTDLTDIAKSVVAELNDITALNFIQCLFAKKLIRTDLKEDFTEIGVCYVTRAKQ